MYTPKKLKWNRIEISLQKLLLVNVLPIEMNVTTTAAMEINTISIIYTKKDKKYLVSKLTENMKDKKKTKQEMI